MIDQALLSGAIELLKKQPALMNILFGSHARKEEGTNIASIYF